MRIIAYKTLVAFIATLSGQRGHEVVAAALAAWYHEVKRANWRTSADLKQAYRNASIVGADRVVFTIKGNSYRLVVAIDYQRQVVLIKRVGSHAEYDRIDVRYQLAVARIEGTASFLRFTPPAGEAQSSSSRGPSAGERPGRRWGRPGRLSSGSSSIPKPPSPALKSGMLGGVACTSSQHTRTLISCTLVGRGLARPRRLPRETPVF